MVAEIPWMHWLTYAVAVVEPVLSACTTIQCHHLIACCTADAKKWRWSWSLPEMDVEVELQRV